MTFAFFDFYPIISQGDTFYELLSGMIWWTWFSKYHLLVLMFLFGLSFTPFTRIFKRRFIAYSIPITLVLLLVLSFIEKGSLNMKLSDMFVRTTMDFTVAYHGCLMFFFIPLVIGERIKQKSYELDVLSTSPVILQLLFLAFFLITISSFGHNYSFGTLVISIVLLCAIFLSSEKEKISPEEYILSDAYSFLWVFLCGLVFSFFKIGYVVCNVPFLREYFRCVYY